MWWFAGMHRMMIDAYVRHARGARTLVDAGCGTGGLLRRLKSVAAGAELYGVDAHPVACAIAEAKSGIPVLRGSVERMPFARSAGSPTRNMSLTVDSRPTSNNRMRTPSVAMMSTPGFASMEWNHGTPTTSRLPRITPAISSPSTAGCPQRTATCPPSLATTRMIANANTTDTAGASVCTGSPGLSTSGWRPDHPDPAAGIAAPFGDADATPGSMAGFALRGQDLTAGHARRQDDTGVVDEYQTGLCWRRFVRCRGSLAVDHFRWRRNRRRSVDIHHGEEPLDPVNHRMEVARRAAGA
jgi:hypothetical protein